MFNGIVVVDDDPQALRCMGNALTRAGSLR